MCLRSLRSVLGLSVVFLCAFLISWVYTRRSQRKLKQLHKKRIQIEQEKDQIDKIETEKHAEIEIIREKTEIKVMELSAKVDDLKAAADKSRQALSNQLNELFR